MLHKFWEKYLLIFVQYFLLTNCMGYGIIKIPALHACEGPVNYTTSGGICQALFFRQNAQKGVLS